MRFKFLLLFSSLLIVWLLIIQTTFYFSQKGHAENALKSVISILFIKNNIINPYESTQAVLELENLNLIRCSKILDEKDNTFLSTEYKGNCKINELFLDGTIVNSQFSSYNGKKWKIKIIALNSNFFYISLWLFRITGFIVLAFTTLFLYKKSEKNKALIKLEVDARNELESANKQARHDLSSPIMALKVISQFKGLDPQISSLLKDLLSRTESIMSGLEQSNNLLTKTNLKTLINNIVNEKKLNSNTKFHVDIPNIMIVFDKTSLERIISNILNNSIEAPQTNNISIKYMQSDSFHKIRIEDNGLGFPQEILKGIKKGLSINKNKGSGLGLYHAKNTLEQNHGRFHISNLNPGARVEICIKIQ